MVPSLSDIWAKTLGDDRVKIAVIDGQVDISHPCFKGASLEQIDVVGPTSCHVAQIIETVLARVTKFKSKS